MTTSFSEGTLLWEPTDEIKHEANVTQYMQWHEREKGLSFKSLAELWQWSVEKLEDFWASLWEYFHIQASKPYTTVLVERKMPGAVWFPGAELNYAEHVFRNASPDHPALLYSSERQPVTALSWEELRQKVAAVAQALRVMGVQRGDRVVAYMPNIPQTLIAFLATASIGATWSSCAPDFGMGSVIDRFKQIEPKVLFAVDGYQYGGKALDRRSLVADIQQALPTLQKTVLVPYLSQDATAKSLKDAVMWTDVLSTPHSELTFEQVPFAHPLWVLYSSGTTGLPKAIVQGHGAIVLEHMKQLYFDINLKPSDTFFWYTTTGWMMWNLLIGGLLRGVTILMYDGSPGYPDMGALWKLAQDAHVTFFGTSAGFISSCMKAGIEPSTTYDLSQLRGIGSTGSPLAPEGFAWIYEHVKKDVWLASLSGGTDVCSAFVGGSVTLPVYSGELQCRSLGAKVESFDEQGTSMINEVGELVITEPMPSMPLFFWNDPEGKRYHDSYFDMYPGVWRHGDWIKITPRGGAIIYGRSDSTINRMGIRMGSSEIYRVVEGIPEILDSLIVGVELPGGKYYMPLFVVLREGVTLDDSLKATIKASLRKNVSPHHVPDEIFAISDVPRTLSGKKLEVPVKKLLMGVPIEKASSTDSMSNPKSMDYFVEFANNFRTKEGMK
jgi:acetoacetyl-CoA synthetase